jgi:putrescine transport system ATP-binding protein
MQGEKQQIMSDQSNVLAGAGVSSSGNSAAAQDAADNFVQIVDVVKKFGETVAVKGVNLSVKKGELFALLGSSGCGKSTLLRMVSKP